MTYLPQRDDNEQARVTADFMHSGRAWMWKRITSHDGFKWLVGLSKSFARIEGVINQWMEGLDITTSTDMIDEWEECAGIPDISFSGIGTLNMRQRHVITKLCSGGVLNNEDYVWICSKMGLHVNVFPGMFFYNNFDPRVGSFSSKKEARFTMVFEFVPELSETGSANVFPLPFPIQFGQNNYGIMQNYIRRIIPCYVDVKWIISDMETWLNTSDSEDIKTNTSDDENIIQGV